MDASPIIRLNFLDTSWSVTSAKWSRLSSYFTLSGADGLEFSVGLGRCAGGRLQSAYPASVRDLDLQLSGPLEGVVLTEVLTMLVAEVRRSDPGCRRIVFAATDGDLDVIAAAERAGFRYVVDVELADGNLALLVDEPDWVTSEDKGLNQVPQS